MQPVEIEQLKIFYRDPFWGAHCSDVPKTTSFDQINMPGRLFIYVDVHKVSEGFDTLWTTCKYVKSYCSVRFIPTLLREWKTSLLTINNKLSERCLLFTMVRKASGWFCKFFYVACYSQFIIYSVVSDVILLMATQNCCCCTQVC